MSNFANRLKQLRLEKGHTYRSLSKEVGISTASLCRWENDKNEINSADLVKLAKYFNVSVDYLLGLVDYENK